MSNIFNLSAGNISFYTVPAAWFLAILPHHQAIMLSHKSKDLPAFKNVAPREFTAQCRELAKSGKQTPDVLRYLRLEAASMNGFENLPFFAAAVVAGNMGRIPVKTLNQLSIAFLLFRILYNVLYDRVTSEKSSGLRSLAYLGGAGACFTMFIKAGNALYKVA